VEISGRSALVTGGASGLGLATVELLIKRGARVVFLDLPSSPGKSVAERLGRAARFVPGDVTSEADATAAVEAAALEHGGLSILVNCAGIGIPRRIIGKDGLLPLDEFRRVIEVNLVGTFNVLRIAARQMAEAEPVEGERGVIVNTASVAAFDGQIGQASYTSSKAAIAGLTLVVARDLASRQIRCCTIAPGIMDTPLLGTLSEEVRAALSASVPNPQRLGRPNEYAMLAAHIIENGYLNGETIRLDGAIRMAPR
jgi:NAD(P)-dependent dehydrogenase (short-subunit alcohol dehydrogenase family)